MKVSCKVDWWVKPLNWLTCMVMVTLTGLTIWYFEAETYDEIEDVSADVIAS